MAYDALKKTLSGARASKEYLQILQLAAQVSESAVEATLGWLIQKEEPIRFEVIEQRVLSGEQPAPVTEVEIAEVDLSTYDRLLEKEEEVPSC